ncbi:hypothetical protein R1sor_015741 [Riccia sorocarpa]|uniref:Uncharacterized protein n=1 Tax=Riccia sorocarpa TaxID=122646 RepID=A0ABD3HD34_9MARC
MLKALEEPGPPHCESVSSDNLEEEDDFIRILQQGLHQPTRVAVNNFPKTNHNVRSAQPARVAVNDSPRYTDIDEDADFIRILEQDKVQPARVAADFPADTDHNVASAQRVRVTVNDSPPRDTFDGHDIEKNIHQAARVAGHFPADTDHNVASAQRARVTVNDSPPRDTFDGPDIERDIRQPANSQPSRRRISMFKTTSSVIAHQCSTRYPYHILRLAGTVET